MGFFKKIKKFVKKAAPIAGAAAGAYFGMPMLGSALGGAVGGGAKGGIGGLLSGAMGSGGTWNGTDFGGGGKGGFDFGNLAGIAGAGISAYNSFGRKAPKAPNYTQLAQQQAQQQQGLLQQQIKANRPNQNNSFGSSQWQQGPNGEWTQNVSMNPAEQARLDQSRSIKSGLMGQAANSMMKPLDFSGLPSAQFNMDPTGNNQAVQDATYQLTARDRQQQREGEIQRLKSQGLPEDSESFQRAMARLDDNDRQAQFSSLLAGRTDYGNSFNRGLNQSQNNQQLRDQGTSEQLLAQRNPLDQINMLDKNDPTTPTFGNFATAGEGQAADVYGAGQAQFGSGMDRYNAKGANLAGAAKGLFGLAGARA